MLVHGRRPRDYFHMLFDIIHLNIPALDSLYPSALKSSPMSVALWPSTRRILAAALLFLSTHEPHGFSGKSALRSVALEIPISPVRRRTTARRQTGRS